MPLPFLFRAKVNTRPLEVLQARDTDAEEKLIVSDGPVEDWNANLNCDTSPPSSPYVQVEMSNLPHHFQQINSET